jgi:ABC-2 type transport system ATP-binding protein
MSSETASPIIRVENVTRKFRSVKKGEGFKGAVGLLINPQYQFHEALKGVSFTIEEGSFNGLIGANGAGKTTLLKILSGLIPPTTGNASVLGYVPFKRSLEFRKSISLVMGQKAQLWWDLPAIDAFDLLRAIYEIPNSSYQERLQTLSELLDVKKHLNTQIRRLSLGERMKMELIGALIHWPKVIFLDEPTIGLDVLAAHKLREFLKIFNQKERATIILTSHNMDDIERLCSRVIILREGTMIFDGEPHKLKGKDKGEVQLKIRFRENPDKEDLSLLTHVPISAIEETKSEDESESRGYLFHIQQSKIPTVLQTFMARFQIVDMGIEERSLEKVIQQLYAEAKA